MSVWQSSVHWFIMNDRYYPSHGLDDLRDIVSGQSIIEAQTYADFLVEQRNDSDVSCTVIDVTNPMEPREIYRVDLDDLKERNGTRT